MINYMRIRKVGERSILRYLNLLAKFFLTKKKKKKNWAIELYLSKERLI